MRVFRFLPRWGSAPALDETRSLTVQDFTVLWALFLLGFPAILAGLRLAIPSEAGGLGFSFPQLVLATLLGALIGSGILAAVGWVAAYSASPTVFTLRPTLGVTGSYVLMVINVIFLLGWAALELRVSGLVLDRSLEQMTGLVTGAAGPILLAVAAGVLLWLGPKLVASWWARPVAVWAAFLLFLYFIWDHAGDLDLRALLTEPRAPGFWAGVDVVVLLAILWFPVVGDMARLVESEESAASGAGVGFGVAAIVTVVTGALIALGTPGLEHTSEGVVTALSATAAGIAIPVLVAWALFSEADQAFALVYGATSALIGRIPGPVMSLAGLAVALAGALMIPEEQLAGAVGLLLSVYAPLAGVFLADFFIVRRRRYNVDAFYRSDGEYRGVNWLAVLPVLLGFLVYQAVDPTGPYGWVEVVELALLGSPPLGERFIGLPPGLLAILLSFLVYAVVGRLRVKEEIHITTLRGRF